MADTAAPDIFGEARRDGHNLAGAARAAGLGPHASGHVQYALGGVVIAFFDDGIALIPGGEGRGDMTPEQLTHLSGLLAGVAEFYGRGGAS